MTLERRLKLMRDTTLDLIDDSATLPPGSRRASINRQLHELVKLIEGFQARVARAA